jgi:hypothetical protein
MLERLLALIAMLAMMAPWTKTSHREVLNLHVLPANVCETHPGVLVKGMIYNPDAKSHTIGEHYRKVNEFFAKNPECKGWPWFSSILGEVFSLGKTPCDCAQNGH